MNDNIFQRPEMELPSQRSQYTSSSETLDSEFSLHRHYHIRVDHIHVAPVNSVAFTKRIPYATLTAGILCCIGFGIFFGTMYRGATLSALMLDQIFHIYIGWLETIKIVLVLIGVGMGALTLITIFIGFLTTGAPLQHVNKTWQNRTHGHLFSRFLMGFIYILQFFWIFIFGCLVVGTFIMTVFWNMCTQIQESHQCIDFTQFLFLFPQSTHIEYLKICETQDIQFFCNGFVEKSKLMFSAGTFGVILILISLVHYLMCLSANYVHISGERKLKELQDMHYLKYLDLDTSMEDN